ncbi:MAG: transporter substrate-binding domain-containing protein [Nitrospirota bacterium]
MENRTLLLIRTTLCLSSLTLSILLLLLLVNTVYAGVDPIKPNTLEEICTKGDLRIGVAIDDPSKIKDLSKQQSVPAEAGYPPYLIPLYNDNNKSIPAVGLDIEVIRLIEEGFKSYCKRKDKEIKTVTVYYAPFDSLFESLRTMQIDLLIAAISPNIPSEMRRGVTYSQLYTKEMGNVLAAPRKINLKNDNSNSECHSKELEGVKCSLFLLLKGKNVFFLADTVAEKKLSYHTGIPEKLLDDAKIKPHASLKIEDVFLVP